MGGIPSMLFWLLLQLLIRETFQDGNFTSTDTITPVLISADVTVVVTLGTDRSDLLTSPVSASPTPVCLMRTLSQNYTPNYQQSTLSRGESSNSSTSSSEASLDGPPSEIHLSSQITTTLEVTVHVTNITNSTIDVHEQLQRGQRESEAESTCSNDQSAPGNDAQKDFSARWIAHLRKRDDRKRKLWVPKDEDNPIRSSRASPLPRAGVAALAAGALYLTTLDADRRRKRQKTQDPARPPVPIAREPYNIVMQPETRPISHEQLVAEVKGIYAGLVMVEAKCIEVNDKTALSSTSESPERLSNEQWQALIALHRCLLHEHHDFLLASQHPSASPALRRLASKYAMPARMWRHGIHSFLELLRHRLPDSYDHMLAFVYLAYSMMALLYETVPAFEDTWIECLGDLARYRMAIEDEDLEDRKVWAGVGHRWYSIASQRAPTTGRLYHHLAILTREDVLQQLSLFSKSLCVSVPLSHARTSILALLDPVLAGKSIHLCLDIQLSAFDLAFVKTHGLLFSQELDLFEAQSQEFFASINSYIDRIADKFLQDGYHIAIANSAAMLGYGSSDNPLMCDMKDRIENFASFPEHDPCDLQFEAARQMAHATLKALLLRMHDPNVLAGIHASLVFMHDMVSHPWTAHLVQIDFPWASLADFVNNLLRNYDTSFGTIDREDFPIPKATGTHPFPEDIAMRGLLWAETYFPDGWFPDDKEDKPETASTPLMTAQRKERILWLAARIARKLPSCLKYEPASFNPVCAEFNEPRFSTPRNLYSSDQTWDKTGIFETFSHVSESSSSPFMEILGSVASRSRNDDSSLDGIQATLGLPVDPLGQHPEDIGSPYQPSSGSSTPPIKDYHETLDSWLSDLINLDMVLDENFEHREAQEAEPTHLNAGVGNVIPDICSTFPVDVIVFSQTGDGQHPDDEEHPDGNSEPDQNLERDRDEDHERQDMGEAEKPRILKSTAEPKTYDLTSPLLGGKEYPRVEPNPFLIDCPRPHEILEAKVPSPQLPSPSSSSSSPGKPHACYHCNKAFSRASDMNKHIKYHTRPITCPVQGCDYTCGRQKDLSRHQHGVHKDMFGEEEFPCPFEECKKAGVKFSRRDNLGRHLKRRHGGATGEGDQRKVRGMSEC